MRSIQKITQNPSDKGTHTPRISRLFLQKQWKPNDVVTPQGQPLRLILELSLKSFRLIR